MTTYRQMTVEHLGDMADENDLAAFRLACERVLPAFGGDEQAATDYIWNDGAFGEMLGAELRRRTA